MSSQHYITELKDKAMRRVVERGYSVASHYFSKILWLCTGTAVFIVTGNVQSIKAQERTAATGGVLEEVVVTARKRAESLQETPIAVSAFTADDLEQRNLTNLMELTSFAPNVSVSTASPGGSGGSSANVYIRGVGQNDFLFTTDPGVGIYVDGVYYPRTVGGVMDLLDLERVEVLRGPQGTLFGKNTIGGAINVISAKPTGETGGYAEVTVGKLNRIDARGSVDFSVIPDTLLGKVSFSTKNRDGYGSRIDFNTGNITDDDIANEDQTAARAALRWLVSEDISVDLAVDYTTWDQNSAATSVMAIDTSNALLTQLWNAFVGGPAGTVYDQRFFIPDNVDDSFGTGANSNDFEGWGFSGTIEWDMDWATARSITAYREFDAKFGRDGDGSPLPINHTENTQKQDQLSQELQLFGDAFNDRLHWQTGFFYFDEFGRDENDVVLNTGLFAGLEGLPGPIDGSPLAAPTAPGGPGNPINVFFDLDLDLLNEIEITSMALYAQGTYELTERLSVTAGLRYTYEEKEYTLEHLRKASGVFSVPFTVIDDSWNELTPMGSIQYQWTDDIMTYATVSEGFKSGGFNGRPLEIGTVESFDPEFVTSYELGIKSEWMNRRLRVNAAAFFMDYKDLQINAISFSARTGSLQLRTDNIASAEVQGIELEIRALPMEGLDIGVNLGYLDFKISDLEPSVIDVTADNENIRTPEWTASAYLQYNWPWKDYGEFSLRGDWAFEDENFTDITNTPLLARKAHSLFNARLSFDMPQHGWTVALFGTNLGNKRVVNNGTLTFTSSGNISGPYNRPREWGVTIRKTF